MKSKVNQDQIDQCYNPDSVKYEVIDGMKVVLLIDY